MKHIINVVLNVVLQKWEISMSVNALPGPADNMQDQKRNALH